MTQPNLGFPRTNRLTQARDFDAVFKRSEAKIQRKALRIRARANRMHGARLGLVVAKRNVPKAHDRNRLKRICRETFRLQHRDLPAADIVVQITASAGNRELAARLRSAFQELAQKIGDSAL